MTGGQVAVGGPVPGIYPNNYWLKELKKFVVVSDEPEQFTETRLFGDGVEIRHRDEMIPIKNN